MCWGPWSTIGDLFQIAFWVLLVVGGIWFIRRLSPRRPRRDPLRRSLALLNERYARGDIDRDEYLERRVYLE